ncbi:peptide/nickel transport system permease protein [Cryobacterium sp. MP_M5]|uniref:ABC transporter permease n=1 Tax=unclassified Cryobacterium TaxID=2649013 RepID=UPI0018CBC2BB|nr:MULTISPECIES: ABC transporter permease [unclassified Cryobacterium]MBG6057305.1 peptide/nickel transport system permease protein [Cryobacterium sp. MP_M3]MEC5175504.1 peptide/nickel transport system permease protein [Cryobacterium sp. MP_M5]
MSLLEETNAAGGTPVVTPAPGPAGPDVIRSAKPLSRGRLIWRRLTQTSRFWVGAIAIAVILLWAVLGPLLYPYNATGRDPLNMGLGPTQLHWFGTNNIGQDLYAQTLVGLQKSIVIGLIAGPLGTLIAAVVGSVAGYMGGVVDRVLVWCINLLLVLPSFILLVILSPLFKGLSWVFLTIFIAGFSWMIMAQVVRSQTKSLRDRDFVKAARYMGVPMPTILGRHIIPNIASLLIIDATLGVVASILAETGLSYFGFGIRAPDVSLGTLLAEGTSAAVTRPWLFVFPAGVLILTLFAVSLIGDALRDAVDPTSGVNRD